MPLCETIRGKGLHSGGPTPPPLPRPSLLSKVYWYSFSQVPWYIQVFKPDKYVVSTPKYYFVSHKAFKRMERSRKIRIMGKRRPTAVDIKNFSRKQKSIINVNRNSAMCVIKHFTEGKHWISGPVPIVAPIKKIHVTCHLSKKVIYCNGWYNCNDLTWAPPPGQGSLSVQKT